MKSILPAILLCLLFGANAVRGQSVIFVDAATPCTSNCDGLSWAGAFSDLQDALASWQTGQEIWVARGMYTPGNSSTDAFVIRAGMKLCGGFAPGALSRSQRNLALDSTILSGNIGLPQVIEDNSGHILSFDQAGTDVRIDGFVVEDGYSNDNSQSTAGSAALIRDSSPTFVNCIFRRNFSCALLCSEVDAIMVEGTSSPVFFNCLAYQNRYCGCIAFLRNDGQGEVRFVNSTVYGDDVYCGEFGGLKIQNSIFWIVDSIHNVTDESPVFFAQGASVVVENSDLSAQWNGPGSSNFDVEPKFLNPAALDFRLMGSSALINQADTSFLLNDTCDVNVNGNTSEAYPHDLASVSRVMGGGLNPGAYEFNSAMVNALAEQMPAGWKVNYSNPVSEWLVVKIEAEKPGARQVEMVLQDLFGRVLRSHPVPFSGKAGQLTLDLSGLAKGVYLLTVVDQKSGQWIHRSRAVKVN